MMEVDVNDPKLEPVRNTLCRWVGSAELVLLGNMEMFDFAAITAGTMYENADETDADKRRWPEDTKIVIPGQNKSQPVQNYKCANGITCVVKNLIQRHGQLCK